MIHEGRGTRERFCEFLEKTVRESGKKILIVVDRCSMRTAKEDRGVDCGACGRM